jgi:hypothetical protein
LTTTNNGPSKSPGLLGGYLGAAYDPFVLGADPADPDFRVESVEGVGSKFSFTLNRADRNTAQTSEVNHGSSNHSNNGRRIEHQADASHRADVRGL